MNHLNLTKFKSCNCGNTVESEETEIDIRYSAMGWFWWSMGTTAIPKQITFRCKKCDNIFETLLDKELIKYYIFYRKH